MTGHIYRGDEVSADQTIQCDACVIGSGAGGAWVAHQLVRAGKNVVMLEEGGHHTRREFDMTEGRAFTNLYQELGNRATDDQSITMLQGRSVGGSTTVNWCSSFRTPPRVLETWRERFGIATLSTDVLAPHWDAVEARLHIAEWPLALMNANNRVLWDGLGKLGYERKLMRRNVNGCLNIGYCGMGCPVDAKQSMLVTTIPDAVERGLTVYANASARTIATSGRRATAVNVEMLDPQTNRPTGVKLTVRAKAMVVSGGAVNSPGVLLRSGLDAGGRVGERTWLHPVVASLAEFEHDIAGYGGAPQTAHSRQFIERGRGQVGFFLEAAPLHPMLAAVVSSGSGPLWDGLFSKFQKLNALIALSTDGFLPEERGATVRLRRGAYSRYSISYDFLPAHFEAFLSANKEMARIQFAAGAKRVVSLHVPHAVVMESVDDIGRLDRAQWAPTRVRVVSAHLMGGCAMGSDPATSVVDPHLRFHTLDNLFVVDGSVFPTSLGVNPQLTIYGIARWAAGHIGAVA